MLIGDFDLSERPLVVAEIGNNHEGRPDVARELVENAARAGAGAVKLQVFEPERFVRPQQPERLQQLSRFRLPPEEISSLCARARDLGLAVLATPLDMESLDFIAPQLDGLKIASGDNDFHPLIERVADTGLPMVISTGLAELPEIEAAVEVAEGRWREREIDQELALLHCVSAYPVSAGGADLGRIVALREALGRTVGYSDHTVGIEACVEAAALGARLIEKHFTLDHDFSEFRDHKLSADPGELAELVERVADPPAAKVPPEQERARRAQEEPNRDALRRSIVAAADMPAGHELDAGELTWMRPRDGLAPGFEHLLVGRALRRPVKLGEPIVPADLEAE